MMGEVDEFGGVFVVRALCARVSCRASPVGFGGDG